ncbi:MAG: NAD(P)-dependent oxidoreductase [Chthoniobacterales bacterium]
MKLFVIGATGRTGQEIVQQALARGHQVTAFVRSPENITAKSERLTVLKGNVLDENQLFNAMQNHDAVISTLGPRQVFKPSSMLHDSALATTRAMDRAGVKRLVVLSAAAHFPGIPNRIASSSCEIICAIRWPWKKSCDPRGLGGPSHGPLVSPKMIT